MGLTRLRRTPATTDAGSASVLLLALGIALVILAGGVSVVGSELVTVRRGARVADLAALAAASQVVLGQEIACEAANTVAVANQVELRACHTDGLDVVVSIRVSTSAFATSIGESTATTRAGPVVA